MDGNGRWAAKRSLPRTMGHKKGVEALRRTIESAAEFGVRYLTFFGFSSENWNRPEQEVNDLMNLLRQYLSSQTHDFHEKNARLTIIGDRSAFDNDIVKLIQDAEDLTRHNNAIHVIIALNYGGKSDIAQACKKLIQTAIANNTVADIDIQTIEQGINDNLYTAGIPDPDLMIRTSGETRISNFLLWQCAYSEMLFIPTLWPDFGRDDMLNALDIYANRERRFGGLKDS
ncbi:MAG: di-trans,poly-cis-decaprenylcistransferase [Alphaproteobacteria bacterium]|nr:di-trans,poly-cis-decaprenylcistransferase [Alphaproteobacteria bacterium]